MNTPTLTKEQQVLLDFYSRIPRAQRTIALRIVEEMAKQSGHTAPIETDDTATSNDGAIHLQGERAERFHSVLADVADAATSLRTAAKLFPNSVAIQEGQMHPTSTITAFSLALDDLVGELMAIACGDDLKRQEASHA